MVAGQLKCLCICLLIYVIFCGRHKAPLMFGGEDWVRRISHCVAAVAWLGPGGSAKSRRSASGISCSWGGRSRARQRGGSHRALKSAAKLSPDQDFLRTLATLRAGQCLSAHLTSIGARGGLGGKMPNSLGINGGCRSQRDCETQLKDRITPQVNFFQ